MRIIVIATGWRGGDPSRIVGDCGAVGCCVVSRWVRRAVVMWGWVSLVVSVDVGFHIYVAEGVAALLFMRVVLCVHFALTMMK